MKKTLIPLILVLPTLAMAQVAVTSAMHVSTNYYLVTSKTVRAAFREATLKNPGKPSYAYTTINSHYTTEYANNSWTPKSKTFYFSAVVTIPKFEGSFATNQYFKQFEKELIIHEQKHVEIGKINFLKMVRDIGPVLEKSKEEAIRGKLNEEHRRLHAEVDTKDKVKFHTMYDQILSK